MIADPNAVHTAKSSESEAMKQTAQQIYICVLQAVRLHSALIQNTLQHLVFLHWTFVLTFPLLLLPSHIIIYISAQVHLQIHFGEKKSRLTFKGTILLVCFCFLISSQKAGLKLTGCNFFCNRKRAPQIMQLLKRLKLKYN